MTTARFASGGTTLNPYMATGNQFIYKGQTDAHLISARTDQNKVGIGYAPTEDNHPKFGIHGDLALSGSNSGHISMSGHISGSRSSTASFSHFSLPENSKIKANSANTYLYLNGDDWWEVYAHGTRAAQFANVYSIINPGKSTIHDFIVKNGVTNLDDNTLYADAGIGKVGIGVKPTGSSVGSKLQVHGDISISGSNGGHITASGNITASGFISASSVIGVSTGSFKILTGVVSASIGHLNIGNAGEIRVNDNANTAIKFVADDQITISANSANPNLTIKNSGVVFNTNGSNAYDYVFESDDLAHMFSIHADLEKIAIGSSAPPTGSKAGSTVQLHGDMSITGSNSGHISMSGHISGSIFSTASFGKIQAKGPTSRVSATSGSFILLDAPTASFDYIRGKRSDADKTYIRLADDIIEFRSKLKMINL